MNVDWNCLFYNKTKALRDIEKGVAVLITKSSFTPIVYTTDKNFKRKYNVDYSIEGCVAPDHNECVQAYNETVFEYLDKKYGLKWRKEVRKDIIGL